MFRVAIDERRCSAYAVKRKDLERRSAIFVLLKTLKLPDKHVRSTIEGFEHWKPCAPGVGLKLLSIKKRDDLSWPYQPLRPTLCSLLPCFSCTKAPATAPAPEFMYL